LGSILSGSARQKAVAPNFGRRPAKPQTAAVSPWQRTGVPGRVRCGAFEWGTKSRGRVRWPGHAGSELMVRRESGFSAPVDTRCRSKEKSEFRWNAKRGLQMRATMAGLALIWIGVQSASAVEWWHDPDRGCGTVEGWKQTHRIADLIGCDGELPKGAPPGEVAMHDAKWALRTAENLLDGHNPNGVQRLLDRAASIMNAAPSDARVNFARLIYYKDPAAVLSNRLAQTSAPSVGR